MFGPLGQLGLGLSWGRGLRGIGGSGGGQGLPPAHGCGSNEHMPAPSTQGNLDGSSGVAWGGTY